MTKLSIDPLEELLVARYIVHGPPRGVRTMEDARRRAQADAKWIRRKLAR